MLAALAPCNVLVIQAGVVILQRFCYGGIKIEQLSQAVQVLAALASSSAGNREGWLFYRDFAVFRSARTSCTNSDPRPPVAGPVLKIWINCTAI